LLAACQVAGKLADRSMIAFHEIALDTAAALDAPIPPSFALSWIFVERSALDDPALHACQQRLSRFAPVTIAVHVSENEPAPVPDLPFKGGAILQPYSDTTFPLVASLIRGFAAK
jgi:hypothetical protein